MTTGRINQVSNAVPSTRRPEPKHRGAPAAPGGISQPPRGRVSLRHETVRLDKLPAVGLPRHEHSLNATLELHLLEPRRTSRLWSRGSGQTTSTLPPIKAGGGAQDPFCGGLLIKLLIEYQYSSPNSVLKPPEGLQLCPVLPIPSLIFQSSIRKK